MTPKTIAAALLLLALSACSPTMATRGNFVEDDRLKTIQLHVSTKDEVQGKLGTPTTIDPFDNNKWFYIGEKTETTAFFDPKVDARKVMALTFSEDGLLQSVETVDEKSAKEIEVVKKTTPSPGREMNAFEQFFTNLGKFNSAASGIGQQQGPGRQ